MQAQRQNRIPEQQGIGQTLPPVPVGIDPANNPPPPPGAMPPGTRLQVGKYQVIVHNFLAEGGFAHVYIARIEGKSGYVVLKRVAVPDGERLKMVEKEIAFMRRLGDHKNIVRYYESRIDALPVGGFEALILMEYCPGGGVIDLMNRRLQQRLTEPEILKIFSDVAEALAYMHYCNPPVLHRDLKVENILILNQSHYKLCDFGSASLSKGAYIPSTLRDIQMLEDDIQRHTTLQYRAPEMIDVYQKRPVNEKADIWAMGVLLYKLCYYTTPFEEEGQLAILNARYTIPSSPMFSEGLRRLIVSMLQEDQNRRPNIYQVLSAVCHLRGLECPIRDIYTEPIITPPFGQQQQPQPQQPQQPQQRYQSTSSSDNGSIFEKVSSPTQDLPNITPMRRGRPTKPERSSIPAPSPPRTSSPPVATATAPSSSPAPASAPAPAPIPVPAPAAAAAAAAAPGGVPTAKPARSYDPFDPSHVNKSNTKSSSSSLPTSNMPASFQNSFIPDALSSSPIASPSSVPPRVQSAPITQHVTPKPQMATKILQTQPSSPVAKATNQEPTSRLPESDKTKLDSAMSSHIPTMGDGNIIEEDDEDDEDDRDLPKMNKRVSSSIEARFMAIKNASRNNQPIKSSPNATTTTTTATTTTNTTSSSAPKKNKPAPPPKPARFRSQQTNSQVPTVDDFEHKFPSLEELDKTISS